MAKSPQEQIGVDLPEEQIDIPEEPRDEAPEVEQERPEWLPTKFDSPEKLAEAYSDLERKLGEQRNEIGELRSLVEQNAYTEPDQGQQYLEQQDQIAQVADQFGIDYEQAQAIMAISDWRAQQLLQQHGQQLQQQIQQSYQPYQETTWNLMAERVDQALTEKYPDFDDQKGAMMEYMQARPAIFNEQTLGRSLDQTTDLLDMAYRAVKADSWMESEQQMAQAGLSAADMERQRKLQAQTVPGRSGPVQQSDPNEEWLRTRAAALNQGSYAAMMSRNARPA